MGKSFGTYKACRFHHIEREAHEFAERYPGFQGLCLACIKAELSRLEREKRESEAAAARAQLKRERESGAKKCQSNEITLYSAARALGDDSGVHLYSWVVKQGLVKYRTIGFDGRYTYIKKQSFLEFLEKLERNDPEITSKIPPYLLVRWQLRTATARYKLEGASA